jgi:hypothetical protein
MAGPNVTRASNAAPQPDAGHAQSAHATNLAQLEPSDCIHRSRPKRYRAAMHLPARSTR